MTLEIGAILAGLVRSQPLDSDQVQFLMIGMRDGKLTDAQTGAVLTALRMRGESGTELAAAAAVLRESMVRLELEDEEIVDTCGTGGDAFDTFNISTAAALIVAGAGVKVVKHGNRAISSKTGSADVLEELGVPLLEKPESIRHLLGRAGLAFCFAPKFHPAWKAIAPIRAQLKIRTLFNALGPLANPALARYQVIGVGPAELLDPMADAIRTLGTRHTFVVRGEDGLGEVSLSAPTQAREVSPSGVRRLVWQPEDFGLPRCRMIDLHASSPKESAVIIREILDGREGPALHVAMANAAVALLACGVANSLVEATLLARGAIEAGRARQVLDRLRESS